MFLYSILSYSNLLYIYSTAQNKFFFHDFHPIIRSPEKFTLRNSVENKIKINKKLKKKRPIDSTVSILDNIKLLCDMKKIWNLWTGHFYDEKKEMKTVVISVIFYYPLIPFLLKIFQFFFYEEFLSHLYTLWFFYADVL